MRTNTKLLPVRLLQALLVIAGLVLSACEVPFSPPADLNSAGDRALAAPWAAGTTYQVGDLVSYQGVNYSCRIAHTAIATWEPPYVLALWLPSGPVPSPSANPSPSPSAAPSPSPSPSVAPSPSPQPSPSSNPNVSPWTIGVSYKIGDVVSYQGVLYTCRIANTAIATWEPPNVPALWVPGGVAPTPSPSSNPTPSPSTAPSPTPSPNPINLPKHLLTGYWHNFNNGAAILRISQVPTTYTIIAVSFADATATPGAVTFNLDPGLGFTKAQFIADIATVKARGQHVIISVGGQNGTIVVNNSTSATNFANSINSLMNEYGFEGVDIDLENGVNATFMAQALRAIRPGSIITMAPQTIDMQSVNNEYFKLALAIKDILTIVNMQYYNSGSMLGYDGRVYSQGGVDFLTALATIQLENGLRPDQVGLGLPASPSGAGSGYVSPTIVNNALDSLTKGINSGSFIPPRTYPTLRGAMTWSINWDASNGYNFANTVAGHFSSLP